MVPESSADVAKLASAACAAVAEAPFPVLEVRLFGSYSLGTQRPESDLDLVVVVPEETPTSFRFLGEVERHFQRYFAPKVHVLVSQPMQNHFFKGSSQPVLAQNLAPVVLYG